MNGIVGEREQSSVFATNSKSSVLYNERNYRSAIDGNSVYGAIHCTLSMLVGGTYNKLKGYTELVGYGDQVSGLQIRLSNHYLYDIKIAK